jgi:hypothetical protein
MKHKVTLTITCLLSILFFALHWADDVVRGISPGGISSLGGVLILVVWLYGTLVLGERRLGYVIMLLGGMFGLAVLVAHMRGAGLVGGKTVQRDVLLANSSRVFFWVWTLIALAVTSTFSAILSARGLWSLLRGQPR